ncbi:MAG: hypothetical protein Q9182_007302, partial [Xanthomendoza sp. 2 TL-2023]
VFGYLADRALSRRPIFLLGLLALAFATTLLYIGTSLTLLTLGRVFQGMASAVVQTLGISLIVDKAPPDQLGSALGIIGTSIAASVIVGPVIGGFLYRYAGYHSVFVLSFALLGLDILLRIMVIEDGQPEYTDDHETPPETATIADANGSERAEGGSSSTLNRVTERSHLLNSSKVSTRVNDEGWLQRYVPSIVWLLLSPRIWICLVACFINAVLLTSFESVVPLFVADTFNWNADQQGLVFLTICGGFLFGPFTGTPYQVEDFGTRTVATSGFALNAPAFMSLQLVQQNTQKQQILLCILLSLIGLFIAPCYAATMAEINHSVQAEVVKRPERFGARGAIAQANSLQRCAFAGGTAVGPLLAGFLKNTFGWGVMSTVLGAMSLATAPLTWLWLGGPLWRSNKGLRGQEEG